MQKQQTQQEWIAELVQEILVIKEKLAPDSRTKGSRQPDKFHGKISWSNPPWNGLQANLLLDLHAQARETEHNLKYRLGLPARERGGSEKNTELALKSIVAMCATADEGVIQKTGKNLSGWVRRARIALGETEAPRRLPKLPGAEITKCPWCRHDTLRAFPTQGRVICVDPECTDEEGTRPTAEMVWSEFENCMILRWMDGVAVVPEPECASEKEAA